MDRSAGKLTITIPISREWKWVQWSAGIGLFVVSMVWTGFALRLLLGEFAFLLPVVLTTLHLAWAAHYAIVMIAGEEVIELDEDKLTVSIRAPHRTPRAEWQRSALSLFVAGPRYVEMYSIMAPSQKLVVSNLRLLRVIMPGRCGLITLLGPSWTAGSMGAFLTNEEALPVLEALWSFWPEKRPAVPPPRYP
jgi:hypothetical protein